MNNYSANPEQAASAQADPAKAISDYLLSKFFENIDQKKFANLA